MVAFAIVAIMHVRIVIVMIRLQRIQLTNVMIYICLQEVHQVPILVGVDVNYNWRK